MSILDTTVRKGRRDADVVGPRRAPGLEGGDGPQQRRTASDSCPVKGWHGVLVVAVVAVAAVASAVEVATAPVADAQPRPAPQQLALVAHRR